MVEDASQGADRHFKEQAEQKDREAEAERQQQLEAQAQRIEEERAKLQKEIDDLEGRGLGPTFSAGQKENLIKQVQERIRPPGKQPRRIFQPVAAAIRSSAFSDRHHRYRTVRVNLPARGDREAKPMSILNASCEIAQPI